MKWINDPAISIPHFSFENLEASGLVINAFTARPYRKDGKEINFFQPLLRKDSIPSEVDECIHLMVKQFGTDREHLVRTAQKHTTNIHIVNQDDLLPLSQRPQLEYIDGLITNIPGVMLESFGADCPSVYLLDPVHRAIGLCHSGRKGTQNKIAAVMANAMKEAYESQPGDLLAAISPGICLDCYEVGEDVANDFVKDFYGAGSAADHLSFLNGKYHIDLFASIKSALISIGVREENIEVSHICTRCRKDILYSFRGEGKISNENCGLLMLKK